LENSSQWIDDFFVQRGELFLEVLNYIWYQSEPIVKGIVELAGMLRRAGWTMLAAYDDLRVLQTFTPKSSRIVLAVRAL